MQRAVSAAEDRASGSGTNPGPRGAILPCRNQRERHPPVGPAPRTWRVRSGACRAADHGRAARSIGSVCAVPHASTGTPWTVTGGSSTRAARSPTAPPFGPNPGSPCRIRNKSLGVAGIRSQQLPNRPLEGRHRYAKQSGLRLQSISSQGLRSRRGAPHWPINRRSYHRSYRGKGGCHALLGWILFGLIVGIVAKVLMPGAIRAAITFVDPGHRGESARRVSGTCDGVVSKAMPSGSSWRSSGPSLFSQYTDSRSGELRAREKSTNPAPLRTRSNHCDE
jgi:hypothetical protein